MSNESPSLPRCGWVNLKNPLYVRYHDEEWGRPCHDDRALFQMLILECFQAGLSWECILNKREGFREAFDHFDPEKVAAYTPEKLTQLAENKAIVRNQRKIAAAVTNARVFLQIRQEWGTFDRYLWHFTDGRTLRPGQFPRPASTPLSDRISKDLKKRGMKFVGTTIIYSYLQATGVVNDHEPGCWIIKN